MATIHSAALNGISINDVVAVTGAATGNVRYDSDDVHGQKYFLPA